MQGCVVAAVAYTEQSKRIKVCVKQEMCKNRFYELYFVFVVNTSNIKIHSRPLDD